MATASVASADVALTGAAEMGIVGPAGQNIQFYSSLDVTFTLTGESDHGVTFGATIDLDEVGDDCRGTNVTEVGDQNGNGVPGETFFVCAEGDTIDATPRDGQGVEEHSVFVSGAFGRLTMGDTDGAFDWAMIEVNTGMAGSINDDHTGHAGFNGNGGFDGRNDGQVARFDYSFGDFAFAVSAELDDDRRATTIANPNIGVIYGVGATYSTTLSGVTLGLGLGYQGYTNASIWGASVRATMDSGISAVANYSASSGTAVVDTTHWGIGLGYAMDAFSVHANYGSFTRAGANNDTSGFGVSAAYDLGGGMVLQAGYGNSNNAGAAANTSTYSFGASMSF